MDNEIRMLRAAAKMIEKKGDRVDLHDGQGRVVMFDILRSRAEDYLRYYPGGRIVESR